MNQGESLSSLSNHPRRNSCLSISYRLLISMRGNNKDNWERFGRKADLMCAFLPDFDQRQDDSHVYQRIGEECDEEWDDGKGE